MKINVLTPVFNRQDCIERCIKSVLSQNYNGIKHILVNDGSTDNTSIIIKEYAINYEDKIKLVEYENNKGINYAFNRGIEIIDDGYVLILGSDDFLTEGAVEKIIYYYQKYPQYSYYLFVPQDRVNYINSNEFLIGTKVKEFNYLDWLREKIYGDFVHLIHINVLKAFPFYEEFRLYEYLNFLRLYKHTNIQLFVNEVVVVRERDRKDALTNEELLFKKGAIRNQYFFLYNLLKNFQLDYKKYAFDIYIKKKIRLILFGFMLSKNEYLIFVESNIIKFILIFSNVFKLGFILRVFILTYSYLKFNLRRFLK